MTSLTESGPDATPWATALIGSNRLITTVNAAAARQQCRFMLVSLSRISRFAGGWEPSPLTGRTTDTALPSSRCLARATRHHPHSRHGGLLPAGRPQRLREDRNDPP